jgi:hypothetical protein
MSDGQGKECEGRAKLFQCLASSGQALLRKSAREGERRPDYNLSGTRESC